MSEQQGKQPAGPNGQEESGRSGVSFSSFRGALAAGLVLIGLASVSIYYTLAVFTDDERIEAIIDRAKIATNAYVKEHRDLLTADIRNISEQVSNLSDGKLPAPGEEFNQRLAGYAYFYRLASVFVTDRNGQVLGGSDPDVSSIPVMPDIERLDGGDPIVYVSDRQLAAVIKLPGLDDAFLFITRDLNPQLLGMFGETKQFIQEFERSKRWLRERRFLFVISYGVIAGLILVIALTWGIRAANRADPK